MHNNPQSSSVDLKSLPASERISYWNDVININFAPARTTSDTPGKSFGAQLSRIDLGKASICRISSAPILSVRDVNLLKRQPLDHFFLSYLIEGEARVSQNGRRAVQRPGDFILYDSERPFAYEFVSKFSGIWIRLPRYLVASRLPNAEAMTARRISSTSPLGALASSFLIEAANLTLDKTSPAAARVVSSIVEIVAAVFAASSGLDSSWSSQRVNVLDRAKEFMLAHLNDPDLHIEDVVKAIGVSRRTLDRLFAAQGTSLGRWISQKRIELSRSMLANGGETRVTDIALSCGFSDVAHFSRVFKNQVGVSPSQLLRIPEPLLKHDQSKEFEAASPIPTTASIGTPASSSERNSPPGYGARSSVAMP